MILKKTIVLTGASGFLGKHVLDSFLRGPVSQEEAEAVEYQIFALYGGSHANFDMAVQTHASKFPHPICQIQTLALDLTNATAIHSFVTETLAHVDTVDVCLHLAAMANPAKCQESTEAAKAINVPTHFFQAMIEQKKCRCMIALSTDHVYEGTKPPYEEEEDDSDNKTLKPINVYGSTKYEMEQYLLQQQKQLRLRDNDSKCQVILLRSSIILGPAGPIAKETSTYSSFLDFCSSRRNQETLFWTDEKRNVIWVGDVVAVLRWFVASTAAATAPDDISGKYNMGGPKSVSRYDMAKAVFEHLGYETKFYLVPMAKGQEQAQRPKKGAPTPLDISMKTQKLQALLPRHIRKFKTLEEMVQASF